MPQKICAELPYSALTPETRYSIVSGTIKAKVVRCKAVVDKTRVEVHIFEIQ